MSRVILPAHPVGEDGSRFLKSLDTRERALHTLAAEQLGSSYFTEKSLGFKKWVATATATAAVETPNLSKKPK